MGRSTVLGRRADRRLAVVLAVALLAPTFGPAAGYEVWAWFPDHGHAVLGAMPGHHSHPWDSATPASTDVPVEFTAGNLLGGGVLPVLIVALAVIPILVVRAVAPLHLHAPRSAAPDLEAPPPR